MAKIDCDLRGSFQEVLMAVDNAVMGGSITAKLVEQSDFSNGDTWCAVRAYERYSYIGNNRVSLCITLVKMEDRLHITAIASGGSQAVFFKINTFGEQAFIDTINNVILSYK